MAAKKRKPTRPSVKKVVKKSTTKAQKKPMAKSKVRKVTATAKKVPAVKKLSLSSVDKAFTKGQLFTTLAGCTGLQRKEISL